MKDGLFFFFFIPSLDILHILIPIPTPPLPFFLVGVGLSFCSVNKTSGEKPWVFLFLFFFLQLLDLLFADAMKFQVY